MTISTVLASFENSRPGTPQNEWDVTGAGVVQVMEGRHCFEHDVVFRRESPDAEERVSVHYHALREVISYLRMRGQVYLT